MNYTKEERQARLSIYVKLEDWATHERYKEEVASEKWEAWNDVVNYANKKFWEVYDS